MSTGNQRLTRTSERHGFVRGLLTDHLFPKILAIILASVLIAIIDREQQVTLFDGEVDVVVADAAASRPTSALRRELLLTPEGNVAVRRVDTPRARLVIRGPQRLAGSLKDTRRVSASVALRESWLQRAPGERGNETPRAIDGKDVETGLGTVTAELFPPVQVILDRLATREVRLIGQAFDVAGTLTAKVAIDPPTARVLGPASWLEGPSAISEAMLQIPCGGRTSDFKTVLNSLPPEFGQKFIRFDARQVIEATVSFVPAEDASIEVPRVALRLAVSPGANWRFVLPKPLDSERPVVTVRLSGARSIVDAWRDPSRLEELRRMLRAEIDTDRLVARAAVSEGTRVLAAESVSVEVFRIPTGLKLQSVEPSPVEVTVIRSSN